MPTYEYACRNCGHHIEVVQSFTDDPLQTCERCQGQLRKVFSAAGIIFKGSGYYVTDTRKAAATAADGGDSSSDSTDGKGSKSDKTSTDGSSKSSDSEGSTSTSESKSA